MGILNKKRCNKEEALKFLTFIGIVAFKCGFTWKPMAIAEDYQPETMNKPDKPNYHNPRTSMNLTSLASQELSIYEYVSPIAEYKEHK